MKTSSIKNSPSKTKMTLEEFGKMIQQKNNALIEEKLNSYNLLSFTNKDDETSFSFNDNIINNQDSFISPFLKSNDSTKIESGKHAKSIFSSGSSSKIVKAKLIKVDNPFKKELFRKRLMFEES